MMLRVQVIIESNNADSLDQDEFSDSASRFDTGMPMRRFVPPASSVLLGLERSHIDGEAVLYIRLEQSVTRFIDLLNGDNFYIGGDVVLHAKIEHLLDFGNPAAVGFGDIASPQDQSE